MIYKGDGWSSNVDVDDQNEFLAIKITNEIILEEADTVLKNFRKLDIEWEKEFEDVKTKEVDIFDNLMPLNPGKLYLKMQEKDLDGKTYGLIPLMASGSNGAIGFLPAQSFCERCNSIAKDVMSDAHTLMNDEDLEMMVVLRMNRKFMEYMRTQFSHLTKQQFGMTMVSDIQPLN